MHCLLVFQGQTCCRHLDLHAQCCQQVSLHLHGMHDHPMPIQIKQYFNSQSAVVSAASPVCSAGIASSIRDFEEEPLRGYMRLCIKCSLMG